MYVCEPKKKQINVRESDWYSLQRVEVGEPGLTTALCGLLFLAGWTGLHCEDDINECLPQPCNQGICIQNDPGYGYTCFCRPGFVVSLSTLSFLYVVMFLFFSPIKKLPSCTFSSWILLPLRFLYCLCSNHFSLHFQCRKSECFLKMHHFMYFVTATLYGQLESYKITWLCWFITSICF